MRLVLVYYVRHKPCLQSAGMVSAGLEVICYHIVYKACLSGIDAGFITTLCPFCHANGEHALVFLAEEHSLYVGTLTLPGM